MAFIVDLKNKLEEFTGVQTYPMNIPQGVALPALECTQMSYNRNGDSSLDSSNILNYRIQITIVTKTSKDTLDLLDNITDTLEGFSGTIGSSKIMICRIQNTVPVYNSNQQTYEYAIDAIFNINK